MCLKHTEEMPCKIDLYLFHELGDVPFMKRARDEEEDVVNHETVPAIA